MAATSHRRQFTCEKLPLSYKLSFYVGLHDHRAEAMQVYNAHITYTHTHTHTHTHTQREAQSQSVCIVICTSTHPHKPQKSRLMYSDRPGQGELGFDVLHCIRH